MFLSSEYMTILRSLEIDLILIFCNGTLLIHTRHDELDFNLTPFLVRDVGEAVGFVSIQKETKGLHLDG
jgi:hypothetical protein